MKLHGCSRMSLALIRATDLALLVAGPGTQHAIVAAEFGAALHRPVLGPPEMGIERPAERAAGILGVDRHRGAALVDDADDLAIAGRALGYRRGAGVFNSGIVEAIAVSPAGADRERAGGLGCADRGDQDAKARGSERKTSRDGDRRYDHWRPLPRRMPKA